MSRFPAIRAAELVRLLKTHGYVEDRQRGSHLILRNVVPKKSVAIPIHTGQDLGRGLVFRILKQADLTPDDFLNW